MAIPIFEVEFDKTGGVFQAQQEEEIRRFLTTSPGDGTSDVVVLSHGWNNDMDEARTLYRAFLGCLEPLLPAEKAGKVIAIGVLWPSKKFADQDPIPGGAAGFSPYDALAPLLAEQIAQLKHTLGGADADAQLDEAAKLLPGLEDRPEDQKKFVGILGALLAREADPKEAAIGEGTGEFGAQGGDALLYRLSQPLGQPVADPNAGGAASMDDSGGGPAGLRDVLTSITAGASRLLNYFTYYVMKDRAGVVGAKGVNPLLGRIQAALVKKIGFHLLGHSFGGRLMTAAVNGGAKLQVDTLLLLQAAFSHNGFAEAHDDVPVGFFVDVVRNPKKVAGPILVTHSRQDQAVGIAYPLASRISGSTASALGDANDVYGGIGRNGAQHMGALAKNLTLQTGRPPYPLDVKCPIYNFNGDAIITSHGDVARPETAWLLAMRL